MRTPTLTTVLRPWQLKKIRAIRTAMHRLNDGDKDCCYGIAKAMSFAFQWPFCYGQFIGPESIGLDGNPLTDYHCWNMLPGGVILDAAADQFGFEPIRLVGPDDPGRGHYLELKRFIKAMRIKFPTQHLQLATLVPLVT